MNLKDKSDSEIESWIGNYEKRNATNSDLLQRAARRESKAEFQGSQDREVTCSLDGIRSDSKFTTYGDLAKASGVSWSVARHAMNGAGGHLDSLLDVCHARQMPLLTALCVNQQSVHSGELSDDSLRGFIKGAQRLGYVVTDEQAFLRQCQQESFSWAKGKASC